ncbi:hypothetical protein I314_06404 [Cryptococcus bacillisporus CA1873]|uniref:Uncharacterized protein n=1 Tax=Cryptococcus bacillisporus CA1873 TaxID=1296111 RepID=A0ABR5B276_CRYGA|nr:hypothetical protein I314_06404 [Cryptococcus bacillisporus CA1873]|eukprot:KIR57687.1 hypothetical protein I314_06404 [Cryptococcus gattii CA1873]
MAVVTKPLREHAVCPYAWSSSRRKLIQQKGQLSIFVSH